MEEFFKKYKIELEKEELEKFEKFLEIFKQKNSQINLSAIRDDNGIIEKHFVDSVMLNIFLDFLEIENPKVADLGTGGGFPLIPLAIVNPEVNFVGIDSVGKKLKAIDEFVEELELKNVKTLNGRAEEIGQNLDYRENFDFVVSRATAYLPTLLEYAIPLLKVGGIFCAYKLEDKEELKSAKKALTRLGTKILKVKNYRLADQDRTIIFFEKLEKTHTKYPRKNGIPLQNPIK
ncbi:16S rRNA (guanine(527)-N(7))-methyltransferase RsmG [Candidatus Gracilibacteria bacterium HOT-871]|nr:16S rRNA (guanine(527)-N(7))-methyltransferase RsmG [Candidatus Gracilibacteria bacterium HOT-871]RKW22370.1 MAG: 16S rRNA (guanine(527)-N(7))-methyltransferase RsmG [Candidatus Gracilibacteria bacterium]